MSSWNKKCVQPNRVQILIVGNSKLVFKRKKCKTKNGYFNQSM